MVLPSISFDLNTGERALYTPHSSLVRAHSFLDGAIPDMFSKEREEIKKKFIRQNPVLVERVFNENLSPEDLRECERDLIRAARRVIGYSLTTVNSDILNGIKKAKKRIDDDQPR